MSFPHAMSPIRIGKVTLPNRIVRAAHVTMLGLDHPSGVSDRLIAYHEARARGGIGLTFLEICSGHPSSPAPLNAFNPGLRDGMRRLVDAVRPHGMHLFQQIWLGGHNARPLDGSAPWSASDIPSPLLGIVPQPMTRTMIDEAIAAYVLAARTAAAAGIEGIEVHAAHGYLLQQFLSPITNRREDDYGGCLENRRRLLVEVLDAVRAEVGEGVPVGVRIGPDYVEGGVGVQDCVDLVRFLEDRGGVDFFDISQGSYFNIPKIIGAMHEPAGYQLEQSVPIAAAASVPTIVTGRFRTLEEADQIIRLGQADCVSMVRATIAEPALVRKSVAGQVLQARPCIGCNQVCIGNQLSGKGPLACTVNPAVGFEVERDDALVRPADAPRRILVVGGGPAGMEAARVAALRGHEVILCEADKALGGKLRLASRAPYRATIGDVAVWLESEVFRLGVDVRLNTFVDIEDLAAFGADALIYAAGAWPRDTGFNWGYASRPLCSAGGGPALTSFDILAPGSHPGDGPFMVVDDVGHYEGIAVAEFLLEQGAAVSFVTRHSAFAHLTEAPLSAQPAIDRLSAHANFRLLTRAFVTEVGDGYADLLLAGGRQERIAARSVILIAHGVPARDFPLQAAEGGYDVRVVGDACSPRLLDTAMREGRLAGLAV